jgi:hypothetical protein
MVIIKHVWVCVLGVFHYFKPSVAFSEITTHMKAFLRDAMDCVTKGADKSKTSDVLK